MGLVSFELDTLVIGDRRSTRRRSGPDQNSAKLNAVRLECSPSNNADGYADETELRRTTGIRGNAAIDRFEGSDNRDAPTDDPGTGGPDRPDRGFGNWFYRRIYVPIYRFANGREPGAGRRRGIELESDAWTDLHLARQLNRRAVELAESAEIRDALRTITSHRNGSKPSG